MGGGCHQNGEVQIALNLIKKEILGTTQTTVQKRNLIGI